MKRKEQKRIKANDTKNMDHLAWLHQVEDAYNTQYFEMCMVPPSGVLGKLVVVALVRAFLNPLFGLPVVCNQRRPARKPWVWQTIGGSEIPDLSPHRQLGCHDDVAYNFSSG